MASATSAAEGQGVRSARPVRRRSFTWLGLVPFFLFTTLFIFLPAAFLVVGSFQGPDEQFTLQNYADLTSTEFIVGAFRNSIEISAVTALLGASFGFVLAYALVATGVPDWIRTPFMTFAGVASNFAGVPLALAFVFTFGNLGLVTLALRGIGIDIYDSGFTLYSKLGLELTYMYFQLPLMILIIAPAIEGLKKEWREASENLGASSFHYWRYVAFPILLPSLLGTMILLFGNAFGAHATAFQLTGGTINLVTIVIGAQIRGDVLHNPGLGYAMAMGMVLIMGASIAGYSLLQRRSERWLR
jgi:putative spermidine/putrescine transport system permease protein